ncbi:MAG: hypothetical protein J0M24_19040 [Verrucomicrobia bacterium]|nr:hypothetical protein [Verrucomicrobiota bacterium]
MIPLRVALVIAGMAFGMLAEGAATPLPGEPTESLLTSPGVFPREFQFKVETPAEKLDPVEHVEKLRYEADRLDLRDRLPDPLPEDFSAQYGSSRPGSAEDVVDFLPTRSPDLWANIDMPVEPTTDFLGVTLLGLGVWVIYRGWKRESAES